MRMQSNMQCEQLAKDRLPRSTKPDISCAAPTLMANSKYIKLVMGFPPLIDAVSWLMTGGTPINKL